MPPNYLYSTLLAIVGVACLIVMVIIWQGYRTAPGAKPMAAFILAMSFWDITYAVFWSGAPGPTPSFWMDVTYFGVVVVPPAFLTFALVFTQMDRWITRPFLRVLCIEPILVLVLMWTDSWHGLFFAGKRALNTTMMINAGPVFWINVFYLYTLVLIGTILLIRKYFRSTGLYRRQTAFVLAASLIPWINNVLFLCGLSPLPNIDNTPFAFSFAALFITYAILRYHFLDLVPIARDVLVENMTDGVIVIDRQNRIIDINPVARRIIRSSDESAIGKLADQVFSEYSDIVDKFHDINQVNTEVSIGDSPGQYFDFRISPLMDRRNGLIGRLIIFRDITELKHVQAKLERMAKIDMLTQVSNRWHFMELADKELKRALRLKHPMTMVMMDLDHFKEINDSFGHDIGDQVLSAFTHVCRKNIREIDLLARFGGEEFVLLIPETSDEQAYQIAERVRIAVADSLFSFNVYQTKLTVSLGIAALEDENDTLDQILHRADQALYTAKQSGRNCIVVWNATLTS